MRNLRVIFVAASLLAVLVSCRQEPLPSVEDVPGSARTKVVTLGDEWDTSSFLVKFATRPSDAELEDLRFEGVQSLEPLFKSFPGKEDLEREFGLDRWFVVNLEEGAELDRAVYRAAELAQVSVVEYNVIATKASDCKVYPASEPAAEAATRTSASGKFNDPMLPDQWHYYNQGSKRFSVNVARGADINVNDVWSNLICGDPDIIVAVVDEGVKYDHPDLAENMWVNKGEIPWNGVDDDNNGYVDDVYGYNFNTDGPISWTVGYYDSEGKWHGDQGHGTHCAGTIAAVNNNNKGVSGIAGGSGAQDGCKIMSCQIFSGNSSGSTRTVSNAIKYAADMGASIISCSFGYTSAFSSDDAYKKIAGAELDAIDYFESDKHKNNTVLKDGNIAIFAAGNENHNYAHYPGALHNIISVSAFGPDFLPTYFTNYGPGCNISAPGGEYYHGVGEKSAVLSTLPKELYKADYGYMQGTSMACPHVSGVVALALSYAKQLKKTFSREEFKQMILASVSDIDQRISGTKDKTTYGTIEMAPYYHQMGTGAIDAWRLMMHIEGLPTLTAQIGLLEPQWIDLSPAFGTASVSLTYLKVEVPAEAVSSMGLQKVSLPTNTDKYPAVMDEGGYAYVQFGRLYVQPTKIGSGKITITAVGGGDHVGGGSNPPGGMELTQSVSLIAREADGGHGTGGWL